MPGRFRPTMPKQKEKKRKTPRCRTNTDKPTPPPSHLPRYSVKKKTSLPNNPHPELDSYLGLQPITIIIIIIHPATLQNSGPALYKGSIVVEGAVDIVAASEDLGSWW